MTAKPGMMHQSPGQMRGLTPWVKGDPRAKYGGPSKERRALNLAIEHNEIPKVLSMLEALYERGLAGNDFAAKLWLENVRGPLKPRKETDEIIERAVDERLMELLSEAKRRKEEEAARARGVLPAPVVIEDMDGETKTNGVP